MGVEEDDMLERESTERAAIEGKKEEEEEEEELLVVVEATSKGCDKEEIINRPSILLPNIGEFAFCASKQYSPTWYQIV